jgi:hypothetical protein|nr:VIT domain-containing protein [Kofleriaceae bacterium]
MLFRARSLVTSIVAAATAAACSGSQQPEVAKPAAVDVVAVPLTNASAQQMAYQQVTDLSPPFSLTATDGSGLQLARVDAKAVFEGPLAFTELHLYFHNTENRRREGTFQITLPSGAAVSRFAMETDGKMVEAEVVDKMVARRAYDDFLHRRQDPALLEKGAGNQFTAKVFPIAANADKHIVISFSQQLAGQPYVLPLRGLPQTDRVDVALQVLNTDGTRSDESLHQQAWKPDRDFVSTTPASAAAVGANGMIAAQVGVELGAGAAGPATPPAQVTLLVDTSASRAAGFTRYVKTVHELVSNLVQHYGEALPIEVIAFDQDTAPIYSGPANGYGAAHDKALFERGAAGASDLEQALAAIPSQSKGGAMRRVLVVTDGVMTAGATGADLAALAAKLDRVDRIDVALAGGIRDEAAATALVRAKLPHAGAVLDLDADGPAATAVALAEPVLLDVAVDVPGATWVYPRVLPTVRAGHRAMVYARVPGGTQAVNVVVGGVSHQMGVAAVAPALVERAIAGAEIDELEAKLDGAHGDDAKQLKDAISKKSVAARVVSSQTAMLVLENDDDYARYHIDRSALADILVVGAHGVEQTHRAAAVIAMPEQPATKQTTTKTGMKDLKTDPAKPEKVARKEDNADRDGVETGKNKVAETQDLIEAQKGVADKSNEAPSDAAPAAADPSGPGGVEGGMAGESTGAANGQMRSAGSAAVGGAPATTPPMAEPPPPPAAEHLANQPSRPHVHESAPSGRIATTGTTIATDDDSPAPDQDSAPDGGVWPPADKPDALTGPLADIEAALAKHDVDGALRMARDWHDKEPGDVLALIGLGDSLEAKHATSTAARVYGSIIDLFPARADLRRFAGERLERLGATPRWLAVDSYQKAVEDRPDHLTGHRLLAYALLRDGKPAEAFAAILAGIDQPYPEGRYLGGDRVLAEDAGMIGAAYLKASPGKRADIEAELTKRNLKLATGASTRFILYWETDGNDVDFHIQDSKRNHAFYGHKHLASGGDLYADITTGYGPECFAIAGTPQAGPYKLSIDYFSQGPMGYGMGLLEVQRYDGKGGLTFEDRPYVIMADHAYVDLGSFK